MVPLFEHLFLDVLPRLPPLAARTAETAYSAARESGRGVEAAARIALDVTARAPRSPAPRRRPALPGSAAYAAKHAAGVNRAIRRVLRARCPHCGNANAATIQTNAQHWTSPDLTFLCVARVPAGTEAGAEFGPHAEPDEAGTVPCGNCWEPNADRE